jgi:hypothetical protein
MEWLIPTQTLHTGNIQLGGITSGMKPMVPIGYKDSDVRFSSLSVLFPSLTVKSFDKITGQLVLSLADSSHVVAKFTNIQELLTSAVALNYHKFFSCERSSMDVRIAFQPMLRDNELHLYCPVQPEIAQTVPFYYCGKWSDQGFIKNKLEPGSRIRIAVRMQGISFHLHRNSSVWSGKCRIQHKILGILMNE